MSVLSGPEQQAAAAAPPAMALSLPEKMPGKGNIHVAGSLFKHIRLALAVVAIVALAGLPAAWVLGTPRYSATAVIFVSPRFVSNLGEGADQKFDSATQYREYVQQNVRTINRFDIVLEALKKVTAKEQVWVKPGESMDRAAARLQGALSIEQVPDTYQITVTLDSKKKEGLAELVNTIAAVYLEKAKSEEFYESDRRVQALTQDRARLQHEMDQKQARRLALAQELGVSSFNDGYLNPYDQLLVASKEAQSDARQAAVQAEAQLASLDETKRAGGAEALRAFAFDQASKDPTLASMMTSLNGRRAQILASLSGLSPDHPGRRAAERELAEVEAERNGAYQKVVDSFSKMLLDQRRADAYKTARVEQNLTAEVARQASQAASFTRGYQEGIQLGLDVDRARKSYDSVQQRMDYFSLEKSAPGFVRLFSAARVPDQPVKGGRRKVYAFFLAAAFALGLAVPVAVDAFDPRIHSPSDVEKVLGFPPMVWLMEKGLANAAFRRDQVLRLANRIYQDQQSKKSQVFAFTAVKAGSGTTTIVVETARALSSLGVPALAVEANAYRTDPRYRTPDSRGLAVVLTGSRSLQSEVAPADEEMPDRIPVGDVSDEKNLPEIHKLIAILRQAASAYPVILLDVPPILVSVDAEYLARVADVAVLVVEAEAVTKEELRRAAKSLERAKAGAVAAILNRVRRNEANGFGRIALREFETGSARPRRRWFLRWLWS